MPGGSAKPSVAISAERPGRRRAQEGGHPVSTDPLSLAQQIVLDTEQDGRREIELVVLRLGLTEPELRCAIAITSALRASVSFVGPIAFSEGTWRLAVCELLVTGIDRDGPCLVPEEITDALLADWRVPGADRKGLCTCGLAVATALTQFIAPHLLKAHDVSRDGDRVVRVLDAAILLWRGTLRIAAELHDRYGDAGRAALINRPTRQPGGSDAGRN